MVGEIPMRSAFALCTGDQIAFQALGEFERAEERAFMRAVVKGPSDLEEGRETTLGEACEQLGIE